MLSEATVFALMTVIWIVVAGIEVLLSVNKEQRESWSEFVRACAQTSTFFPWGWGVLAGHFFHPGFKPFDWNWLILAILSAAAIAAGTLVYHLMRKQGSEFRLQTWIPLIPGYWAGALLWPVGIA